VGFAQPIGGSPQPHKGGRFRRGPSEVARAPYASVGPI